MGSDILARRLIVGTAVVLSLASVVVIAWAITTIRARPLDGVEGLIFYEAARMRSGQPLYVDPLIGTTDLPPSRYHVLYIPIWSAALSLLPAPSAPVLGRLVSFICLATAIALVARRSRVGWLGATFAFSFFPIVYFGSAGRPDGVALLLASIAFARTLRLRAVDVLAAVLFATAVFVKPNIMGLAAGAVIVFTIARPREAVVPILAGLATAVALTTILTVLGGRDGATPMFIVHLLRSTGQPPSLDLWITQLTQRLPFVTLPLAAAAIWAWPVKDDLRVRLALGALGTSVAWALVSLAKIGSASNYWMEPAIAAIATAVAASEVRRDRAVATNVRGLTILAVLLSVQCIHNGVAALRNSIEGMRGAPAKRAALDAIRARCIRGPRDVVWADEPGLELEVVGRAVAPPFQVQHLFARGRIPRDPWLADIERPELRCVIAQRDELGPAEPLPKEVRQFDPEIRDALRARFTRITDYAPEEVMRRSGFVVYGRR